VYVLRIKDAFWYIWNKTISGKGASEMAHLFFYFIKRKSAGGKKVSSSFLITVVHKTNIDITSLCYSTVIKDFIRNVLEKGHT
jgi:hypothetical protein